MLSGTPPTGGRRLLSFHGLRVSSSGQSKKKSGMVGGQSNSSLNMQFALDGGHALW